MLCVIDGDNSKDTSLSLAKKLVLEIGNGVKKHNLLHEMNTFYYIYRN